MSGDGKRGGAQASVLAPILDSTEWSFGELNVPTYPEERVFRQVHRSMLRYGPVTLKITASGQAR